MDMLFIADPLEHFKTHKDTTFSMMREAARRGHRLWACEPRDLVWTRGARVVARAARCVAIRNGEGDAHDWFEVLQQRELALADAGAVLMRKDPPFDSEYFYATHLLQQAEREGARVFNKPAALRDHPEKLAILEFPQYIGPTIVTRDAQAIRAFHAEQRDIILKPLDGMGGTSIFRVRQGDPNLNVILETMTQDGRRSAMAQRYIPAISYGDKRILLIAGEPVPYALARIPKEGESRGNLAAGGRGIAQPLSAHDRRIAEALGPSLWAEGLLLVGLDVIGENLTEVNVTSPTCMVEITEQTGFDVPGMFIDALERVAR